MNDFAREDYTGTFFVCVFIIGPWFLLGLGLLTDYFGLSHYMVGDVVMGLMVIALTVFAIAGRKEYE